MRMSSSGRISVALTAIVVSLAASGFGQERDVNGTRELVAHVQSDLKRAEDFGTQGPNDKKQVDRYRNAQRSASNFDRNLVKGKYDKGDLKSLTRDVKDVLDHNTLSPKDRDDLASDLGNLRELLARGKR
jgi:hypothetical protein